MTSFRERQKKTLRIQSPPDVRKAFKKAAQDAEMSDSEFGVRLICQHLGLDVSAYGLDPEALTPPRSSRRRAEPAAAV
jgi:hypothetical protein